VSSTQTDRFAIDRVEVPRFYTPTVRTDHGLHPGLTVLAESMEHHTSGWITLGLVSAQTPYGQGTFLGLQRDEVVEADPLVVIANLRRTHPHGQDFRPNCRAAMNASFELALASTFRNWTTGDPGGSQPIRPFSKQQIRVAGEEAARRHAAMMRKWKQITRRQIRAIFRDVESKIGPIA